jgi:hypothetical protein
MMDGVVCISERTYDQLRGRQERACEMQERIDRLNAQVADLQNDLSRALVSARADKADESVTVTVRVEQHEVGRAAIRHHGHLVQLRVESALREAGVLL